MTLKKQMTALLPSLLRPSTRAEPPALARDDHYGEDGARASKIETRKWRKAARGSRASFDALYEAHAPRLRSYLVGMIGPAAPVDDLVQDAFVIAIDRFDGFRGEATPSTWLHGIARNLARNWRNTERRRRQLLASAAPEERAPTGAPPPDPHARAADRGALALLFQQLEKVGPIEREAFVLHWLSELSMREIARLQGVATTTVSARIGRVMAALRTTMNGDTL